MDVTVASAQAKQTSCAVCIWSFAKKIGSRVCQRKPTSAYELVMCRALICNNWESKTLGALTSVLLGESRSNTSQATAAFAASRKFR